MPRSMPRHARILPTGSAMPEAFSPPRRIPDVVLHAQYEIAVATLRGTNTLRPADDLVRAFFTTILDTTVDHGVLEDAVVLGQYCQGAIARGLTGISVDELTRWHAQLLAKIRALLDQRPYPNTEAHLLALSARLRLFPMIIPAISTAPGVPADSPAEVTQRVVEALDAGEPVEVDASGAQLVDVDGGMSDLVELCQRLPDAPMFPVDALADLFDILAAVLVDHPAYRTVRDALDEATDRVAGPAAKADRARNRGVALLNAGRLLDALSEIHDAKVNWWHGDTMRGAVLAMLLVADIYSRLHLPLAANTTRFRRRPPPAPPGSLSWSSSSPAASSWQPTTRTRPAAGSPRCRAANDHDAVLAAERFIAAAQIVLAELASHDAVLLQGQIDVEVRPDGADLRTGAERCERLPSNESSRWIVHLSRAGTLEVDAFHRELTGVLVYILITSSLLPSDQFMAVMKEVFERGLFHKLAMGRPYDEAADVLPDEAYAMMAAARGAPIGQGITIDVVTTPQLRPSTKPGPGYDRQAALTAVQARYDNGLPVIRYTLPRLLADPAFRRTVAKLRGEGWLDWHFVNAIATRVSNERLRRDRVRLPPRNSVEAAIVRHTQFRAENPGDFQLSATEFTEDALRKQLNMSVLQTLVGFGLQPHQDTPDFTAIFAVLGARYGYWTDDVDHDEIFPPLD